MLLHDQHRHFQRLLVVEAGIDGGLVAALQALVRQVARTTGALGDVLAGELDVDAAGQVVRFSRAALDDALSHVPSRIEVFDREGAAAFVLGAGAPKIAAGHNAVFWLDRDTGRTRSSR